MRILHVVGGLNRGGAETWLVQLLGHIDREKYQMDFLVHSAEPGEYDKEVQALGARIIPCLKPSNPLQYAINLRRILRRHGPYDCVHSHVHHFSGYVLMLAAMTRVPMRIAHSHLDTRAIDHNATFPRKAYLNGMLALIRHFATDGIAVSDHAARSLFSESWRSDPRFSLCPLGIDLRPFEQQVDRRQVRSELGIPLDAFVVGHVGRFVEQKNHRFLVEIADRFCGLEPKAVFLLVGDGPLKPEIEALVRARGLTKRFIFTGLRGDVPRLMKGAMDCFLFPSLYEGLGLVLWEAQAAGLPCVISESIPEEATTVTQRVWRLSTLASPKDWALEIQRSRPTAEPLVGNLLSQMKEYTIQASVARLTHIYQTLART
jgi:glycosyltransferase involved in cell wall biosynthesis